MADSEPNSRWPLYERVRFITDRHAAVGAALGSVGYIVEVYASAYEVEVSAADGSTLFSLGAVADDDLALGVDSA